MSVRATETVLAETMLADSRERTAPVRWCACTGCTTKKYSYILSGTFLVVQPVHTHQHTRVARAHESANMVSANMDSRRAEFLRHGSRVGRTRRTHLPGAGRQSAAQPLPAAHELRSACTYISQWGIRCSGCRCMCLKPSVVYLTPKLREEFGAVGVQSSISTSWTLDA